MKYNFLFFFVLLVINNLLHYISEKVIIVIFTLFLFFLMKFASSVINTEFVSKIEHILVDVNAYMNVVFNFLYINKLFYLNLKSLSENLAFLARISINKLRILKSRSFVTSTSSSFI